MNNLSKLERKVITQPYDFSIEDLVKKIESGDIITNPDFQRKYRWNTKDEIKPSRLIESLILNIPIPVLYFSEKETLKYEVIDGQQRLITFKRFLEEDFPLENLEIRTDLNGKKYSELKEIDRDLIRKRSVRAIVVLNESDEQVKFEIFERLNSGSVELTPQELRNAIYDGSLKKLLQDLAKSKTLRKYLQFQRKADQSNMSYEEMILRFFTFYSSGNNLKKEKNNLKFILNEFMKQNKDLSEDKYKQWNDLFIDTLDRVVKYLGDKAFIRFSRDTKWKAGSSSRSLFDAEMLAFALAPEITIQPTVFIEKLEKLMSEDDDFIKSTIGRGRDVKSLEVRTTKILKLLN